MYTVGKLARLSRRLLPQLSRFERQTTLAAEPFANGTNNNYVEQMFEEWQKDPSSVHASWNAYFQNVENDVVPGNAYTSPLSLAPKQASLVQARPATVATQEQSTTDVDIPLPTRETIEKHLAVYSLIRSYQIRGNNVADLDPLGILDADLDPSIPAELSMGYWLYNTLKGDPPDQLTPDDYESINDSDEDSVFYLPNSTYIGGDEKYLTLRQIKQRLEVHSTLKLKGKFMN